MSDILPRATRRRADRHGQFVAVVTFPNAEGEAVLLEVVGATDFLGLALGRREGRQQHGREDRDDRNHDVEFNKRERFFLVGCFHRIVCVVLLLSGTSREDYTGFAKCQTDF